MPILNLQSAQRRILEILASGSVIPGKHCRERMIERNVYMPDVQNVLKVGTIQPGQANGDDADCIFRVYGTDVEGEDLVLVIKILDTENRLELISVF